MRAISHVSQNAAPMDLQKEPTALIGTSISSFLPLPAQPLTTMDDVSAHPHDAFKGEPEPLPSCIGDVIQSQNLNNCEPS